MVLRGHLALLPALQLDAVTGAIYLLACVASLGEALKRTLSPGVIVIPLFLASTPSSQQPTRTLQPVP